MLLIIDLFCGAGGAAMGLHQALKEHGIEHKIWGIDLKDLEEIYPFNFIQGNVFDFPMEFYQLFDFGWFSPPCQPYSTITRTVIKREQNRGNPNYAPEKLSEKYPRLIGKTRTILKKAKISGVIENVVGAPLREDLILCGTMFNLETFRHRVFEIHGFTCYQPKHPSHKNKKCIMVVTKQQKKEEPFDVCCNALGIWWMDSFSTLGEAIPPAYSKYIMNQFLKKYVNLDHFIYKNQEVIS